MSHEIACDLAPLYQVPYHGKRALRSEGDAAGRSRTHDVETCDARSFRGERDNHALLLGCDLSAEDDFVRSKDRNKTAL